MSGRPAEPDGELRHFDGDVGDASFREPSPDPFGDAEAHELMLEQSRPVTPPVWPPRPGIFAAVWPLYLLVGGIAAVAPFLSAKYVDDSIAMPAITAIVCAFMLGLTVLLPLVRLSQARSSDPAAESAMDAFSLLLPLQPLVWFLVVRPIGFGAWRVALLDLTLIGWTSLVAGIIAATLVRKGTNTSDSVRRTLGMGLILALQGAGPLLGVVIALLGSVPTPVLSTAAPAASVLALLSHPRDLVAPTEWMGIVVVWLLAAGVWWIVLAERRSVLRAGSDRALP